MENNPINPNLRSISSMVTIPLGWATIDLEYIRAFGKFIAVEIAVYDILKRKNIFESFIIPDFDFPLSKRLIDRGISKEEIINKGKKIEEIDNLLQDLLLNKICVFWNAKADVPIF